MDNAVELDGFLPTDVAIIEIEQNGKLTGWKITLAGPSHEKSIAWSDAAARKGLHKQKLIESAQVNGKKYKPDEISPEEARRDNVAWVVARIVDWTPIKIGGVLYDVTKAAELLIKPDMGWAYSQIVDWLAEDKAFTRRSATS